MALILVFFMCAFMMDGSYDCDEQWKILVYDDVDIQIMCDAKGYVFVRGCSFYSVDVGQGMMLSLSGTSYDNYGYTTLWHEILHLSCLCDWHAEPPEIPLR